MGTLIWWYIWRGGDQKCKKYIWLMLIQSPRAMLVLPAFTVFVSGWLYKSKLKGEMCICVCTYIHMYGYMCTCAFVYLHIHIPIYI